MNRDERRAARRQAWKKRAKGANWWVSRRAFLKWAGGALLALVQGIDATLSLLDRWRAATPAPLAQAPASPPVHQIALSVSMPVEWRGGDVVTMRDSVAIQVQRPQPDTA